LSKRKRTAYDQYLRNLHDEASWNAHQHFKNETVVEFRVEQRVKEKLEKATEEAKVEAAIKAKMEAQLEIAANLLKNGASVELVAVATGLSIEVIREIQF
jgi:predicted transposase/invertase (TIGR01784 family)